MGISFHFSTTHCTVNARKRLAADTCTSSKLPKMRTWFMTNVNENRGYGRLQTKPTVNVCKVNCNLRPYIVERLRPKKSLILRVTPTHF